MEQQKLTKLTSEVYFAAPGLGHEPAMDRREVPIVKTFEQKPLKLHNYPSLQTTKESLERLQQEARFEKFRVLGKRPPEDSVNRVREDVRRVSNYRDKINKKRQHIAMCLRGQTSPNFAAVAKMARCDPSTVKRVFLDLLRQDQPSVYDYNNMKSEEEQLKLDAAIEGIEKTFKTVSDIKRELPGFSKKYVLETLKRKGYSFRKVQKTKGPSKQRATPELVLKTIQHITTCHTEQNPGKILFVDEMKFPLIQSAYSHWMHPDLDDPTRRNSRPVENKMIVSLVMCSKERFLAVQFCDDMEINAQTFLYFLIKAIESLPPRNYYTILADKAPWHKCQYVDKTEASKFIFINVSMMFQLNLIENAFSFMRAAFRKRPHFDTVEEEITHLARLFFDPGNEKRFRGVYRNHLRTLTKYLDKYWPSELNL